MLNRIQLKQQWLTNNCSIQHRNLFKTKTLILLIYIDFIDIYRYILITQCFYFKQHWLYLPLKYNIKHQYIHIICNTVENKILLFEYGESRAWSNTTGVAEAAGSFLQILGFLYAVVTERHCVIVRQNIFSRRQIIRARALTDAYRVGIIQVIEVHKELIPERENTTWTRRTSERSTQQNETKRRIVQTVIAVEQNRRKNRIT